MLYLHRKHKFLKIEIGGFKLELGTSRTSRSLVKLLGSTINHNLTFDIHVSNIKYLQHC